MSESHTPGPWQSSDFGGGRTIICTSDDPHARFTRVAMVGHGNLLWCESGEANARLIAAAPELLDALRVIAAYPVEEFAVEGKPDHTLFGANDWALYVSHVLAARAAIAKATRIKD